VKWESELGLDIEDGVDPRRPIECWKRLALAAAMQTLSPTERVIVQMHFGWGLPRLIIAQALGVAEDTVHVHISNAQKKFLRMRSEANL